MSSQPVGKQHPLEQFEHQKKENSNMSFEIIILNDIQYHNLNQHLCIYILGVSSESLILKVLPIEVDGLIDLGGLT